MRIASAKLDHFCILFFVISLFFSGSNVYALAFPILKVAVFISFLCLFSLLKLDFSVIKKKSVIQISTLLLLVWLCFTLISSFAYPNEDMLGLAFRYTSYISAFVLLVSLESKYSYFFFKSYSFVLYIITIVSFISYLLNLLQLTSMTELVSGGGRQYFTTFFNITMRDSQMTLGGLTFYRFQSVFEEPGTFAFLLLPAIYWYKFIEISTLKVIVLSVCLIASLSIGAIFPILVTYIIYLLIIKPGKALPVLISLFFLFGVLTLLSSGLLNFFEYKLGIGAYEGQHSSMGARALEVSYLVDTLSSRVLGVGFSALNIQSIYHANISVGLFRLIIYSGAIGGVSIIALFIYLGFYSLIGFSKKNTAKTFTSCTLLGLLFMSLQRSTFIDGFMFIALFSFLLIFNFKEFEYDAT